LIVGRGLIFHGRIHAGDLREAAYKKGLEAVARGGFLEALALFEACIEMESLGGTGLPIAAMSYYGLCLSLVSDRLAEARDICEAAVEAAPGDPDLYLNLGRVCQRQDDRAHAFRTYIRGLRIDPAPGARQRCALGAVLGSRATIEPGLGSVAPCSIAQRRHRVRATLRRRDRTIRRSARGGGHRPSQDLRPAGRSADRPRAGT
jgi:tetratricopeptide (TPR) repeat protein